MKELFRERALTRVSYFQSLLESAGISTFVKNESVSVTEGVCIPAFFPALCVVNDEDYDSAVKLIQQDLKKTQNTSDEEIECQSCHEKSPMTFDTCWNCQAELPHRNKEGES